MATIQVRDVPEPVHRTYRLRAAQAGMSMQEYLRRELIRGAEQATPGEVVAAVEQRLREGDGGWATQSALDVVRADRDGR